MRLFRLTPLSAFLLTAVALAAVEPAAGEAGRRPQFVAAPGSPIAVGPMAGEIEAADMNGDGNLDLVLTCGAAAPGKSDPNQGFVVILAGDDRGGFKAKQPLLPLGASGLKSAVGDLDGDHRLDVAVVSHDSYAVTLLIQDEHGRFSADTKRTLLASKGTRPHTHSLVLADVNGDLRLDVLTTSADDNAVSVHLGDGTGNFSPAKGSPFPAGQHPYEGLSVADVNGDRRPDVVVPNLHGRAVSVLLGDGRGGFATAPGSPVAVGDRPGFLTLGDLDGDARLDVVVTHDDDPVVYLLLGDGKGGFRPAASSPLRLKETVWGVAIADFDRDGRNDVILGGKRRQVLLLLGNGKGGFDTEIVPVTVDGNGPGNIAVADLNRDGKLDLVTSNFESRDVSVLLQK